MFDFIFPRTVSQGEIRLGYCYFKFHESKQQQNHDLSTESSLLACPCGPSIQTVSVKKQTP